MILKIMIEYNYKIYQIIKYIFKNNKYLNKLFNFYFIVIIRLGLNFEELSKDLFR